MPSNLHDRARKLTEDLACCPCRDETIAAAMVTLAKEFAAEALLEHCNMRGVHEPDEAWITAAISRAEKGEGR